MRGFRGFFLADPEDLSLLPLVEQFAESGPPGRGHIFRIPGGNDRLATGTREASARLTASRNHRPARRPAEGRRDGHDRRSRRAPIRDRRRLFRVRASGQHRARGGLRAGAARAAARRDRAPSLRLRDAAAAAVRTAVLEEAGTSARVRQRSADRRRLGRQRAAARSAGHPELPRRRPRVDRDCRTSSRAKGGRRHPAHRVAGKAVRRCWRRARSSGTTTRGRAAATRTSIPASIRCGAPGSRVPPAAIVFAGEHTSIKCQGYMNGAIETGLRAAAEIAAIRSFRLKAEATRFPIGTAWLSASAFRLSSFQLPAFSFQLSASGFRLPASSFRLPASGFQLRAFGEGLSDFAWLWSALSIC